MAEYKVTKSFKGSPDGKRVEEYEKGQIVPLTDSLAEVALAEKWVKPHKPEPVLDPAEVEQIAGVIGQLDPENEDHYTTTGVPEVRALAEHLEFTPSAAERDAAFEIYEKQKASEPKLDAEKVEWLAEAISALDEEHFENGLPKIEALVELGGGQVAVTEAERNAAFDLFQEKQAEASKGGNES